MKTEFTLRYLLLRQMELLAKKVRRERYLETTQSLSVEVEGRKTYTLRWREDGESRSRGVPFDAFVFYQRGDTRPETRSFDDPLGNRNDELAREIAAELLGLDAAPELEPRVGALEEGLPWALLEVGGPALAVGVLGNLGAPATLGLLALAGAEFAPRGRLLASGLFCVVAWLGPPAAAVLGASSYGLLQWLDPNPEQRTLRLALCAAAAAVGAAGLPGALDTLHAGPAAIAALAGALGLAAIRSLHMSHFRALPLALPFYCAGLATDGHLAAAWAGLALGLIGGLGVMGWRGGPARSEAGSRADG